MSVVKLGAIYYCILSIATKGVAKLETDMPSVAKDGLLSQISAWHLITTPTPIPTAASGYQQSANHKLLWLLLTNPVEEFSRDVPKCAFLCMQ